MIEKHIIPETALEKELLSYQEVIDGLLWGKPRNGHPEGLVLYHVESVLKNIDTFTKPEHREKLRLIAILHDTFKSKVDRTLPKYGANHHARIARKFAEKYITDIEILEIIELHDDAFNAWSKGKRKNDMSLGEKRAKELIERLGDSIELYLTFYRSDNNTGDKETEDYDWFLNLVNAK